jgi:hypothetical protein
MSKHYEFEADYNDTTFLRADKLSEWMDKEYAFQSTLKPSDPRNWKMYHFVKDEDGAEWAEIFWGGYAYPYELSRIKRPEDLLWLFVHLGSKDWPHFTGYRIAAFIESVAQRKGWKPYQKVPA